MSKTNTKSSKKLETKFWIRIYAEEMSATRALSVELVPIRHGILTYDNRGSQKCFEKGPILGLNDTHQKTRVLATDYQEKTICKRFLFHFPTLYFHA